MGVHSFWDIVGPTAKPVRLESLQDRRMAVDASIWIYQFLKAVRDQEGNALKNSHVVGFFRRICKLLYFGIKPVFIFDGGVPILKRETIQQRKERRQGKRDNAAITARKLLAIQLQKQQASGDKSISTPSKHSGDNDSHYELFKPQDEWHLPIIPGFKYDQDDQRIMSVENFEKAISSIDDELDNIDLDTINPASAEFEELPKSTQYLILSTLRLRSRLRMGYTKEQLEGLFPNSMDFSKFQIDMVKRRNFFTQKLMGATGMQDGVSNVDDEIINRISGQLNKEYKLTKSENGWTLGLGDLDGSETKKAIILDDRAVVALDSSSKKHLVRKGSEDSNENNSSKEEEDDESDENFEWEDVNIKPQNTNARKDYSIKAARLPQLTKESSSVGGKSFLDKRYDQISPSKRPYLKIVRHVTAEDDDDIAGSSEEDNEYTKQIEEIEMMEAVQKSKNEHQKETAEVHRKNHEGMVQEKAPNQVQVEPLRKSPINQSLPSKFKPASPIEVHADADGPRAILTENEQNLNHIVGKIPDFNFGESNSFLFEQQSDVNDHERERPDKVKKKIPIPEMPAWFRTTSDDSDNPFITSNFVQDKEVSSANYADTSANSALVTQLNAGERDNETKRKHEDIEELHNPSSDMSKPTNISSSEEEEEEDQNGRKHRNPLVFDYDFSEEEEDNIAANMRKEEQEFSTFRNTLSKKIVDKAFMEDELYEQQMKEKRDSDEVTTDMIVEVQDLLSRFGIPYITAPMEAEAQCAELLSLKLVDGIITDDSDVFLFGGTKIYKNMFHERNYVEYYDSDSIMKNLGMDREIMIELAQLLGSDYTNGIKGMGPVSSVEIIAEFGTLAKFRDWYNEGQFDKKKLEKESKFEKDLRKRLVKNEIVLESDFPSELVREAYIRPEVDHDKSSFVWGTPDLDMLRIFMKTKVGWQQEKSDEVLIPLIRDINNRKKQSRQRTLTEFFPAEYINENKNLNLGKRITTATGKLKHRRLK